MTELLQAALAYAEKGWPIFPCRADKTPHTTHGVLDATTNPTTIREWWEKWPRANIGLNVGEAGMVAVDLDPGHDPAVVQITGDTGLAQRTPRGGLHLFFALDRGEVVQPSASKVAAHVDVRSFNSYVLLAPSRTADGAYTWEREGKPARRSDALIAAANASARSKSEERDTWLIEADLPENVEAAIKWLRHDARIAIEGVNGDNTAYATAAHLKSFGISEALAFDLMWEHWNPRCDPPWSAEEADHLERKVANGYSYNTSPPGNITPAYRVAKAGALFKPVRRPAGKEDAGGSEVTAGRFRFVDRAGMQEIAPPTWLVPDCIPDGGFALLVGAPGTYKTFVALDLALSVATGCDWPWHGAWAGSSQGPALFALGEGRPQFRKRVEAWEHHHRHGRRVSDFVLADPVPHVGQTEELDAFIDGALAMQPEGYKLAVIDTVGRAMQGKNENTQEDASLFTALCERLQGELGCAVLALHHAGHDGDRARGSSVFGADADTLLFVSHEGGGLVSLRMDKQKDWQAWERPKLLKLVPVLDSLVATLPETGASPVVVSDRSSLFKDRQRSRAMVEILDQSIAALLAANPSRAWSGKELAEALAMRPEIEVDSKTLQNRYLALVRETKGTKASTAYDPLTRRWRNA